MDRRTARRLVERLNRDAERIARRFNLQYTAIEAERANVKSRYGVCYADGGIKIRLRHAVTGHSLKYSSLVNTLCHELAHLRYFDHGERFKALYLQMLEYARAEGIYRPGPVPGVRAPRRSRAPDEAKPRAPLQLALF
jgi:predicted metal-dependent hydrolase